MSNKCNIFCALGLVLLIVWSCSKEPSAAIDDNSETTDAIYYVRYAANGLEGTYSVNYTSEEEKVSLPNIKGADFERTIGPVSRGFEASFGIQSNLNYTTVAVRIEVRKGNTEPFIVKKEAVKTSSGSACSCSVSYTIE
ncbi:MAG: hypothetical protein SOY98_07965 [Candidatus Cryptobacteroides sp.]|nr:hypothetical protein [Candidatus Cryptobacteroides sp.]